MCSLCTREGSAFVDKTRFAHIEAHHGAADFEQETWRMFEAEGYARAPQTDSNEPQQGTPAGSGP